MIEIQEISDPEIFRRLNECIEFSVRLTDLGTNDTVRALGYQLLDNNDNQLTDELRYDPKDTNFFKIILNHIVKEVLFIKVPSTSASDPVIQQGCLGKFKLKLWEYVTINNCETSKENETTTDLINVLNSSLQWDEASTDLSFLTFGYKLKFRSEYLELGKGAIDYMTVYGSNSIKVEYIKNSLVSQSITKSTVPDEVSNLKIDVLDYDNIKVYQGNNLSYTIIPTCADTHFIFLDPYGSWAGISLNKKSDAIKTEQTEVCSSGGCFAVQEKKSYQQHGMMTIDKKSFESINAEYEFIHTDIDYIKRFLASNNHYILIKKTNSIVFEWLKFILDSGEYIHFEDNQIKVSIKGYLAKGFSINETSVIANS